jgi:hypothetical protein
LLEFALMGLDGRRIRFQKYPAASCCN